jgi:hypothetical protein
LNPRDVVDAVPTDTSVPFNIADDVEIDDADWMVRAGAKRDAVVNVLSDDVARLPTASYTLILK